MTRKKNNIVEQNQIEEKKEQNKLYSILEEIEIDNQSYIVHCLMDKIFGHDEEYVKNKKTLKNNLKSIVRKYVDSNVKVIDSFNDYSELEENNVYVYIEHDNGILSAEIIKKTKISEHYSLVINLGRLFSIKAVGSDLHIERPMLISFRLFYDEKDREKHIELLLEEKENIEEKIKNIRECNINNQILKNIINIYKSNKNEEEINKDIQNIMQKLM